MKILIKNFWIILLAFVMSCASSSGASDAQTENEKVGSKVEVTNPSTTLLDYLRRIPGVKIMGRGSTAQIIVRDEISWHTNTSPLFVVDGVKYGKDFSRVESMVPVSRIQSVEVLKGVEASTAYGLDGSAGVIIITTKKS